MNVTDSVPIRYMSFNLCNVPPMDKNPEWEGLRFGDRLPQISAVIEKLAPDVIGFQEVRDYDEGNGNVIADLSKLLQPLGYRLKVQESSPHKLAAYNVVAYKIDKLWGETVHVWWSSNTPDRVSDDFGNGWPRAVQAVEFLPVCGKVVPKLKQARPHPDDSFPRLLVANSHLGLAIGTSDPRERVLSNQITVEKIKQVVGSRSMFVVSLGDFNSFPDVLTCSEERAVYEDNGFIDAGKDSLKNQNGVSVSGTFLGFSPDTFKCPNDRLGAHLDHMWYQGCNGAEQHVKITRCFVATLTGDPELDSRPINQESDLLAADVRDRYPSDHMPLVLDFELSQMT